MTYQPHILNALEAEVAFLRYLKLLDSLRFPKEDLPISEKDILDMGVEDVAELLSKLQNNFVITGYQAVEYDLKESPKSHTFHIQPSKNLGKYLKAKEAELQYHLPEGKQDERKVLWIEYNEISREILLNGVLLLSIPQLDSVNERVFSYLYKHPNQDIVPQEMFKELGIQSKEPAKIFSDLNFKGDLKKLFVSSSQRKIIFYNPLSKQHIQALFPTARPRLFQKPTKSSETI